MQIILDRRALHRIPELSRTLPKTVDYLSRSLSGLRCQISSPVESCLCAWFDFGADHAIAFRSDEDALPITERSSAEYVSCHPGRMHACGHDGHMAILLELARRLNQKKSLPHNVLLVFQCAEETIGGAKDLCLSGVFQKYNVQAIFGLHLWPGLTPGVVFSRKNEMMSRASELHIDIYGKSAHIAKASQGIDAMAAGVEFYRRVAALEASLPGSVYRLLKFGRMTSGSATNAVSAHTHFDGTLRAFQDEVFEYLRKGMILIGKEVAQQSGCRVDIHVNESYPAVMNPPALYDKVHSLLPFQELDDPCMISEDFSWYQKHMPGLFFFLGLGDTPPLHSDNFDFDEHLLLNGADFFEKLAEVYQ